MPQSLAKLYVHLIFSTKNRAPFLDDAIRPSVHAYMAKLLQNLGCRVVILNSVEDHVHALLDLGRTNALSDVVEELKKTSSKWIKGEGPQFRHFAWQSGYGAFSVSQSLLGKTERYIANQPEHHRKRSFQDEFRQLLQKHETAYDERYVWD